MQTVDVPHPSGWFVQWISENAWVGGATMCMLATLMFFAWRLAAEASRGK